MQKEYMDPSENSVTLLLRNWRSGCEEALNQLIPLVYQQLHAIASQRLRSEDPGITINATALIHEAYLQLAKSELSIENRLHFFALCSRMMRRILIDHARAQHRSKREGSNVRIPLDESIAIAPDQLGALLDIDDALGRLAEFDMRKSEIVQLLFFGGLTQNDAAAVLNISRATLNRELRLAKAWLYNELRRPVNSSTTDSV